MDGFKQYSITILIQVQSTLKLSICIISEIALLIHQFKMIILSLNQEISIQNTDFNGE